MPTKKPAKKKPAKKSAPKPAISKASLKARAKTLAPSQNLVSFVKGKVPANWKGSPEEFLALYLATEEGFIQQAQRAYAKLFPDMARVACRKEADCENPVAEVDFVVRVDFSKINIATITGGAKFVETNKHTAEMAFSRDITQAELKLSAAPAEAPAAAVPPAEAEKK